MIRKDVQKAQQTGSVEAFAVHLVQSYRDLVGASPDNTTNHFRTQLALITLGDWARVSDTDAKRARVVLGVYEGQIVSAYRVVP